MNVQLRISYSASLKGGEAIKEEEKKKKKKKEKKMLQKKKKMHFFNVLIIHYVNDPRPFACQ